MSGVRAFIFSFQTKLILAITAAIVLAIMLAGAIFVISTRDERREQALDRVASASPAIYQQSLYALLVPDAQERPFSQLLQDLAREQDVRIMVVGPEGQVLYDTGERLVGAQVPIPKSTVDDVKRGFLAWEPPPDFPEPDLTFVSASSRFVTEGGRPIPVRIVLAVESGTLAGAWLGLLPSLLVVALIAVPIASLAGVALARQVALPVRKLTQASEAMARGDFDQRVLVDREDEVGRLARAFTRMAEHVGARDAQMRALLANVSHDLKTPMTSITGYAQALRDGTADAADAAQIGEIIGEEAAHVNRLLADLLYLGEIDAGQVITRREDVALADLVGRCVRRIEPRARASGIDVHVDLAEGAVLRGVDADKVERALNNILDNAAKFTPSGGEIRVTGAPSTDGGRVIALDVSNTGSRIAEEDLPRVFDRFFRGDRARRTASGSGLGLAIARQLIELNGGAIRVANEVDGVRFSLSLPGA